MFNGHRKTQTHTDRPKVIFSVSFCVVLWLLNMVLKLSLGHNFHAFFHYVDDNRKGYGHPEVHAGYSEPEFEC